MIKRNIVSMIQSRKNARDQAREAITGALLEYGPCYPFEIKQYIDTLAEEKSNIQFQKAQITFDQIEAAKKEMTLARETVQRKLKELVEEGVVAKKDGKYSISEMAKTEIRYFNPKLGNKFGNHLLLSLLDNYFPIEKNLKERIQEIVSIFGFYILYSLLESCRPIKYESTDKFKENMTKDFIIKEWLMNSFDPLLILNCFIATISREFNYKDRINFVENYEFLSDKIDKKYYDTLVLKKRALDHLRGSDQYHMQMLDNESDDRRIKYQSTSCPLFELSQDKIDEINPILNDLYPDYFDVARLCSNKLFDISKNSSFRF